MCRSRGRCLPEPRRARAIRDRLGAARSSRGRAPLDRATSRCPAGERRGSSSAPRHEPLVPGLDRAGAVRGARPRRGVRLERSGMQRWDRRAVSRPHDDARDHPREERGPHHTGRNNHARGGGVSDRRFSPGSRAILGPAFQTCETTSNERPWLAERVIDDAQVLIITQKSTDPMRLDPFPFNGMSDRKLSPCVQRSATKQRSSRPTHEEASITR